MRGLVYRNGGVRLETDLPDPPARKGEVVIRVALAGICATDIEISKGYMAFEGVLGHEFVGRVDAPDHPEWNGVRVVGSINCACGRCERCHHGQSNHCADRTVLGILGRAGAFAERTALPLDNLVRVPDGIRDEDAVYAEPLAAVLRIREQVAIVQGARIAILGDGRLGLLAACVGIALGWDVSLVGKHPEKMRKVVSEAPRFSSGEAQEGSFDIAVDCTGSCQGLEEALRLLRPRGKLVLKTTVAESAPMNLSPVVINEVEIIGSRCGNMSDAVRFLEQSRFRPSILTTATYPLSRGEEAFKATQAPQNIKVLLDVTEQG